MMRRENAASESSHTKQKPRAFIAASTARTVRVGMEATGHARWFEQLLAQLNGELRNRRSCEPIAMAASYPEYVSAERRSQLTRNEAVIALLIEHLSSGHKMLYCPSLPQLDDALMQQISNCDLFFADATFWDNEELVRVRGNGRSAREMGHLPIAGPEGTLEKLRSVTKPRKVYIHINNTNPILDEASSELAEVKKAGFTVARDGVEFEL